MSTGLMLEFRSEQHNLGGQSEDDAWSRDSTHTDNSLERVWMKDPKKTLMKAIRDEEIECDVVVGAEVVPGDTVYIVWAEYSTGDSFGNDGGQYVAIAAFVNENNAKTCAYNAKNLEEKKITSYMDTDRYGLSVILDNGIDFKFHVPWIGYFENLENVHVSCMEVELE